MLKIFKTIFFSPSKLQLRGEPKYAEALVKLRELHTVRNYCLETPLPPVTPAPRHFLRKTPLLLDCVHSHSDMTCNFISPLLRVGTAGQLSLVFIARLTPRHAAPLISLCRKRRPFTYGPQWPKCITTRLYRLSVAAASTPYFTFERYWV